MILGGAAVVLLLAIGAAVAMKPTNSAEESAEESVSYFRICAAWLEVSTFSMISVRIPFWSKMKVVRMTPMYFLPYILFSPHAPKACIISVDVSARRVNGSSYFCEKLL